MKYIIYFFFNFISIAAFSQKDSPNTISNKPGIKTNTVLKPANLQLKETEKLFKEMEIKLNELNKLAEKLKNKKDKIGEMSQQDMLYMQQLMEKKNQLEAMISNVMKAAAEAMSSISLNLKAS